MRLRRPSRAVLAMGIGTALGLASLAWPLPDTATTAGVPAVRVVDREGALLRAIAPEGSSDPVALDAIAPEVVAALIATEDRRFRSHPGVDPLAFVRAMGQNLRAGRVVSGGSTLTMQVARALRGRHTRAGLGDKLAETHLALRLELRRSKDEILALWLNRVSFGNRAHGIEAAARLYVGKGARDLTVAEAAFLTGLPQSPSRHDPFRHPERARARQRVVLGAMEREGHLAPGEAARLGALPVEVVRPEATFRAPHFVEWVREMLPENAAEVETTLDGALQREAEAIVRAHLRGLNDASVTAAAALVLDNQTGAVLAHVGSADFWDARAGGQVDGARALRQPGSALKPFTYGLALQSGAYTPASILPDLDLQIIEAGGAFSPENYDKTFHGPVPLREALASSFNVPAVRLVREMGPERLLALLRQSGFASLDRPAGHYGVGLTLGNGEVRMTELARAYAGLARGGTLPPLHTVRRVVTDTGDTLRPALAPVRPMGLSPAVAYALVDILSDPEAREPGFGRGGPLELPFPVAVKTGTSKDYRDNWAIGATPRHTVAVWVGNFDGSPMRWVSGTRGAGPILNALFRVLGSGGDFPRPDGLTTATICPASGLRPGAHCPTSRREVMLAGTAPRDTCHVHVAIALDRRTGLRADASTPSPEVESRVYTVYPAEYHGWMRERGIPLPPSATAAAAARDSLVYSDRLRVTYPESGTVYFLDPVLRREYQKARLRGDAEADLLGLAWFVDGVRLAPDRGGADWPLSPGRHVIELRAVTPDGRRLRSRPSEVLVRSVPTQASAATSSASAPRRAGRPGSPPLFSARR